MIKNNERLIDVKPIPMGDEYHTACAFMNGLGHRLSKLNMSIINDNKNFIFCDRQHPEPEGMIKTVLRTDKINKSDDSLSFTVCLGLYRIDNNISKCRKIIYPINAEYEKYSYFCLMTGYVYGELYNDPVTNKFSGNGYILSKGSENFIIALPESYITDITTDILIETDNFYNEIYYTIRTWISECKYGLECDTRYIANTLRNLISSGTISERIRNIFDNIDIITDDKVQKILKEDEKESEGDLND